MSSLGGYPMSAWNHVDTYVCEGVTIITKAKALGVTSFFTFFFYFYFWIMLRSYSIALVFFCLFVCFFFLLFLSSFFLCFPPFSSSHPSSLPLSLLPFLPSLSSFHLFFPSFFSFFIFYWPSGLNPGLQPCCVLGSLSAAEFSPDRLALSCTWVML